MNITSELEKLISLRDRGDLSPAEFEKAKLLLLSQNPFEQDSTQNGNLKGSLPATRRLLGLAAGTFAGNLLAVSIASGDVMKGFAVGAIAAVLVVVLTLGVQAMKSH